MKTYLTLPKYLELTLVPRVHWLAIWMLSSRAIWGNKYLYRDTEE